MQGEQACRRCVLASSCPILQRNAEVLRHLPLALHTAERYIRSSGCRGGADRDDLRSEAALGLIASVEAFDRDAGVRFSSYAVPKMLGRLRHHQRDVWQALHMPRRLMELHQRVRTLQRRRQEQGRPALGLLEGWGDWLLVSLVALAATLIESAIGAGLQRRSTWLSNELVNAIQTTIAALLAMALWPS